ncbi:hypothetical protein OF83DRAFT_1081182 [Amylostereum chailletii]|nr:hypothetical protein OF83DRAFT_1081182 [Amylostereum chailletii]
MAYNYLLPKSRPRLGYPAGNGLDYYRAHANRTYDPALYQNAVNRAGTGAMGVGLHEAEHWHRRAYGGLGEVARMLPAEIGCAAAYEAYRQFTYNLASYSHLFSSHERRRDALTGLAVAEGRGLDQYGLQVASEAAAATASLVLGQTAEPDGMAYGAGAGYQRSRRNSVNYPLSNTYGMDDPYRGRPIGRSSPIPGYGQSSPIPGYGESVMYAPSAVASGYGGASPNPMRVPSPNPMAPFPMTAGGASPMPGSSPMPMSSSPYAGGGSNIGRGHSPIPGYYPGQQAYGVGQYSAGQYPAGQYSAGQYPAGQYPATTGYPGSAGYPGSYTMAQQQQQLPATPPSRTSS